MAKWISAVVVLAVSFGSGGQVARAIGLEETGTERVYFVHRGEPLLSFGGLSDFLFYGDEDAYDYKLWADWAAEHGINHVRAYPPLSWKHIEKFTVDNGGSLDNVLFPYVEVRRGSRKFDLTRFDQRYWERFRTKCEYLQERGIIIHLLMWNGWQLRAADSGQDESAIDWEGHFFNPANNVNEFTEHLGGELENRFKIYHSMADKDAGGLLNAQRWWFHRLIEATAGLDNVYYDLVHELAEHFRDWHKTSRWVEEMALTSRNLYAELHPEKSIVIGMDTGGLSGNQREWIFTRPYFDVLIYGKKHTVAQARGWRIKYKKPYIPQESWDDDGTKYSYRCPNQRTDIRKYIWKFMMARCQQMDVYMKPRSARQAKGAVNPPGFGHNYDPRGWNKFEDDAQVLSKFWGRLKDYSALWYGGKVIEAPGAHRHVLSSENEAVVYLSSATGRSGVEFGSENLIVEDLSLADGEYLMDIISTTGGVAVIHTVRIADGKLAVRLPGFVDDLAVYVYADRPRADEQ